MGASYRKKDTVSPIKLLDAKLALKTPLIWATNAYIFYTSPFPPPQQPPPPLSHWQSLNPRPSATPPILLPHVLENCGIAPPLSPTPPTHPHFENQVLPRGRYSTTQIFQDQPENDLSLEDYTTLTDQMLMFWATSAAHQL